MFFAVDVSLEMVETAISGMIFAVNFHGGPYAPCLPGSIWARTKLAAILEAVASVVMEMLGRGALWPENKFGDFTCVQG